MFDIVPSLHPQTNSLLGKAHPSDKKQNKNSNKYPFLIIELLLQPPPPPYEATSPPPPSVPAQTPPSRTTPTEARNYGSYTSQVCSMLDPWYTEWVDKRLVHHKVATARFTLC